MHAPLTFADLDPRAADYASRVVDRLLQAAVQRGASDIHLDAQGKVAGISLKWRIDGNLVAIGNVTDGTSASIVARIKALARLITYRYDIPQEGRMTIGAQGLEARVGTLPTLHGERVVIRLVAKRTGDWLPAQLGLPVEALTAIHREMRSESGVVLITGTAGAGKTTTAYACLRSVLQESTRQRSVVTLEDPIEAELRGACQSQINQAAGYDWSSGLKALLRQDPEVTMVGEIRDAETAAMVFQAALTGQLVITTMHARSAADALRRLLDMRVPPHHLLSGLSLLLCQRLLRGACPNCSAGRLRIDAERDGHSQPSASREQKSGIDCSEPCATCGGTGSSGRVLLVEQFPPLEGELARSLWEDGDTRTLASVAQSLGMQTLATLAVQAARVGRIHANETLRYGLEG